MNTVTRVNDRRRYFRAAPPEDGSSGCQWSPWMTPTPASCRSKRAVLGEPGQRGRQDVLHGEALLQLPVFLLSFQPGLDPLDLRVQ